MRWLTLLGSFLIACALCGCSASPEEKAPKITEGRAGTVPSKNIRQPVPQAEAPPAEQNNGAAPQKPEAVADKEANDAPPAEAESRKRIFKGRIEVLVENFDKEARILKTLVKDMKGYIASSDDSGVVGAQRSGTYTVRIPAENFEEFLDEVAQFGELRRRTGDSQDITDQYYDLTAHIKNDEVREQGLQKLYDKTAEKGRLEDLLVVDRELSSIRGRIDEQRGRLKRWDKEVAYSMVVVQLSQRPEYAAPVIPERPVAETPSFGTTVGRTWDGSLSALTVCGKALVLFVVAVAPWLAVLGLVTSPLWFLLWRQLRHQRKAKATTPKPEPVTVQPA